jgi:hypothetical protein
MPSTPPTSWPRDFMQTIVRTVSAATTCAFALAIATAPTLAAPPDTGSSSDAPTPKRSDADLQFLSETRYDTEVSRQGAAIALAQSECKYLDSAGNTIEAHLYLTASTANEVTDSSLFLGAAIRAYCPWNALP